MFQKMMAKIANVGTDWSCYPDHEEYRCDLWCDETSSFNRSQKYVYDVTGVICKTVPSTSCGCVE